MTLHFIGSRVCVCACVRVRVRVRVCVLILLFGAFLKHTLKSYSLLSTIVR